ncbi:MAG: T9SS type A sorting domain-containing protein [Bacteroidia bacterium]
MNNTFYCSSSTVCSSQPPALTDSVLNVMIANGTLESEEYVEESRAIAEEYLYRELADDSVLWFSDSTYIQFMEEHQSENTGYLYDAEAYLSAAYTYDSTLMALVDSCNLQITTLTDSIEKLDENHPAGWEVIRDQILYTIEFLNQTIYNLNLQIEALFNDNLTNAELQNSYVVNGELPELNGVYMNEMEINYMETDEDLQFLRDNYSGIIAIASQCPYVGGKAVERARTYIALINDSISYDDANICLQSGVYRFANDSTEKITSSDIKIIPNPANDKVTVQLTGIDDGICKIQIRNVLNEIVYDDVFDCKNQKHIINVSNLSQGVYSISVNAVGKKSIINKLIITR